MQLLPGPTLPGKLPALLDFCAWDLILLEWLPWGPSTSCLSTRYTNSLMAWIWLVLFSAVSQHLLQSQHVDISLHRYSLNKWKMTDCMTPGVSQQGVILLLPQKIFGNIWKYLGMSFLGGVATGLTWIEVRDAAKYPAKHRRILSYNQELSSPKF